MRFGLFHILVLQFTTMSIGLEMTRRFGKEKVELIVLNRGDKLKLNEKDVWQKKHIYLEIGQKEDKKSVIRQGGKAGTGGLEWPEIDLDDQCPAIKSLFGPVSRTIKETLLYSQKRIVHIDPWKEYKKVTIKNSSLMGQLGTVFDSATSPKK